MARARAARSAGDNAFQSLVVFIVTIAVPAGITPLAMAPCRRCSRNCVQPPA